MADKIPKTLKELSRVIGIAGKTTEDIVEYFNEISPSQAKEMIKRINEMYKTEEARLKVYEKLEDISARFLDKENETRRLISYQLQDQKLLREEKEKELGQQTKIKEQAQKYGDVLENVANRTLGKILEQNKEIFKTAKDMQLASNLTWKQYSQAYNEAFEASRRINQEVGQSISNARELIETQNFLMQGGFRGIDISDLTSLSSSVFSLTRTLGGLPNELLITFQQSYRQFGSQTDQFVTNLGNRLNAFSNTFGVSINMLSQTVSEMTQENAFLFRNNMQAQTRANENLMRAAALSGAMGLNSSAFISQIAGTAQFGTMGEVAQLYQGGALLEGFDTSEFQGLMQQGEYGTGTEMLLGSIGETLGGMDDQYLRAEYMNRIGSSFGLSRDDLLMITANAGNLGEISAELSDKVANIDTSMTDELSDLKMSVVDRMENWWQTTGTSQQLGKTLQDLGLVGVGGSLKFIQGQLAIITGQSLTGGKMASSIAGRFMKPANSNAMSAPNFLGQQFGGIFSSSQAPKAGMSALGKAGAVGGGLAVGAAGNVAGRALQTNTNKSDAFANIGGGALNIGSGIAGGALIGQTLIPIPVVGAGIGAAVGGTVGLINTIAGAQERSSKMQEIEDQERAAARQRMQESPSQTGDPVVDAINSMNSNLTNVLNDNFQESIKMSFVLDTANKTDAGR